MDSQLNQSSPTSIPPISPVNNGGSSAIGNGHKKVGPIIATLVIVLILIIAALYVFASRINQQAIPYDNTTADQSSATDQSTTPPSPQTIKPVTGKSDNVTSLQSDLNASTNGVDSQNF